jgi:hypothetical protein
MESTAQYWRPVWRCWNSIGAPASRAQRRAAPRSRDAVVEVPCRRVYPARVLGRILSPGGQICGRTLSRPW